MKKDSLRYPILRDNRHHLRSSETISSCFKRVDWILRTSLSNRNPGCSCSYSRIVDKMCRQDSRVHLSAEEAIAAEGSLSIYCKPVELYNILQRRALQRPSFLRRCLHYKIKAKRKRRLRTGNVIFNYKYYNNTLQKTEVTVNFSCPFCLGQCASFKGLRYHLCAHHDLFNFEFWVTEEYQVVNVSVKTDVWRSEILVDGADPRLQPFFLCSKPRKRSESKSLFQNAKDVHPLVLDSDSPEVIGEGFLGGLLVKDADARSSEERIKAPKAFLSENDLHNGRYNTESNSPENHCVAECLERVASSPNVMGVSTAATQSSADPECAQAVSGSKLAPSAMQQFAKTRKLSLERSEPRNLVLLQKRQFFHSHRAQPMALEQVLADRDSEDEVDDDIADLEDRRMLDDFVDVSKDEKKIMHLWNSFVRKQRLLADGHIPWACEAFSRLHGPDFIRSPTLIWSWRFIMIKLWNHSLLDAHTMDNCNKILERYQNESSVLQQS